MITEVTTNLPTQVLWSKSPLSRWTQRGKSRKWSINATTYYNFFEIYASSSPIFSHEKTVCSICLLWLLAAFHLRILRSTLDEHIFSSTMSRSSLVSLYCKLYKNRHAVFWHYVTSFKNIFQLIHQHTRSCDLYSGTLAVPITEYIRSFTQHMQRVTCMNSGYFKWWHQ